MVFCFITKGICITKISTNERGMPKRHTFCILVMLPPYSLRIRSASAPLDKRLPNKGNLFSGQDGFVY